MKSKVECTVPVMPVKSLKDSLTFYTESLGFQLDWGGKVNRFRFKGRVHHYAFGNAW